jgi:hypothetical protein
MSRGLRAGDRAWYVRAHQADLVLVTVRHGARLVIAGPSIAQDERTPPHHITANTWRRAGLSGGWRISWEFRGRITRPALIAWTERDNQNSVPRPLNERQSLEQEREELPAQLAAYRNELENGSPKRARRERLEWQIREREKRLAEVEARLAKVSAERRP